MGFLGELMFQLVLVLELDLFAVAVNSRNLSPNRPTHGIGLYENRGLWRSTTGLFP